LKLDPPPPFRKRSRAAYLPPRELRREAGDEEDERDDDGHEDAEPQRQPADRDQWRRLRLALAEFLHKAMRLLARVRREPLRLLAELRVQVVVGVARGRALARGRARIVRPFALFTHGHSFAAIPLVSRRPSRKRSGYRRDLAPFQIVDSAQCPTPLSLTRRWVRWSRPRDEGNASEG
jgi:hypothetical protein